MHAITLVPEDPTKGLTFPKKCGCGREYSRVTWSLLPFVGYCDVEKEGDQLAEMRNCVCRSTLSALK